MNRTPFGEQLKREREMRGVSLEEISAATRISTRFLEALENEQWDRLPGGIFNRGFIRAVARFLGLDEESLVAEYALETQDRPEVAVWSNTPSPSRRGLRTALLILLFLALAAAGWLVYRRYGRLLMSWHKARISFRAPAPQTPAPAGPISGSAPAIATMPPASVKEAVTRPRGPMTLKVEAGMASQLKVLADGETVFSGRLAAGQTKTFQAKDTFEVSSSESSAVLLELNGQIMPPLGPTGQPGSAVFTQKDLKKPPGG